MTTSSTRAVRTLTLALCIASTTSCGLLEKMTQQPSVETPTATSEGYLQGGPNTDVELGAGERSLLEEYKVLHDSKLKLETRLSEVEAVGDSLRGQLATTEKERDMLRNQLAGSDQEGRRMKQRSHDLEGKVLSLNIEKTRLEQELMRMRIGSLRQQYEDLTATSGTNPIGANGGEGSVR